MSDIEPYKIKIAIYQLRQLLISFRMQDPLAKQYGKTYNDLLLKLANFDAYLQRKK